MQDTELSVDSFISVAIYAILGSIACFRGSKRVCCDGSNFQPASSPSKLNDTIPILEYKSNLIEALEPTAKYMT